MKTTASHIRAASAARKLALCIAVLGLSSCGMPVKLGFEFRDPDSGLSVTGGYSSKEKLTLEASK